MNIPLIHKSNYSINIFSIVIFKMFFRILIYLWSINICSITHFVLFSVFVGIIFHCLAFCFFLQMLRYLWMLSSLFFYMQYMFLIVFIKVSIHPADSLQSSWSIIQERRKKHLIPDVVSFTGLIPGRLYNIRIINFVICQIVAFVLIN